MPLLLLEQIYEADASFHLSEWNSKIDNLCDCLDYRRLYLLFHCQVCYVGTMNVATILGTCWNVCY